MGDSVNNTDGRYWSTTDQKLVAENLRWKTALAP